MKIKSGEIVWIEAAAAAAGATYYKSPVGSRRCLWLWQLSKDWAVEGRTYSAMSKHEQTEAERHKEQQQDESRREGRNECVSSEWKDGMEPACLFTHHMLFTVISCIFSAVAPR